MRSSSDTGERADRRQAQPSPNGSDIRRSCGTETVTPLQVRSSTGHGRTGTGRAVPRSGGGLAGSPASAQIVEQVSPRSYTASETRASIRCSSQAGATRLSNNQPWRALGGGVRPTPRPVRATAGTPRPAARGACTHDRGALTPDAEYFVLQSCTRSRRQASPYLCLRAGLLPARLDGVSVPGKLFDNPQRQMGTGAALARLGHRVHRHIAT